MEPSTLILGGILLLLVLYKLGTLNHDYFPSRGIKQLPNAPFFGSAYHFVFKTCNSAVFVNEYCNKFKDEGIIGAMAFYKPVLLIKDPEIIKRVTVKDFEHFMDHQMMALEETEPVFFKSLVFLRGEKWRNMRNTLSPAFTSNRLKNMFTFMNRCGEQLADYLQEGINKQQPGEPYVLELKEMFTRFANDVIATTAFGIDVNSLKEKENEFYRTGKDITSFSGVKPLILLLNTIAPKLTQALGLKAFTDKEKNFFVDLIHETITAREKYGIVRPDMIHLLMQASKGELETEQGDIKVKKLELTESDIVSQAMIFFFAGFETVSTHLSFTAILLATNEDAQRKLQREIDETLSDGADLTYEKVQKMKYLDMIISESLRIFPPAVALERMCTKTYTIPSNGRHPAYTVEKGESIQIPVYHLHHNPDYFPDPEKFDPERFSEANKKNIKPYTYLPFGEGPRFCIGQRLAVLETKLAMIHIFSRFDLVVVDKTSLPLTLSPDNLNVKVKGDFWGEIRVEASSARAGSDHPEWWAGRGWTEEVLL